MNASRNVLYVTFKNNYQLVWKGMSTYNQQLAAKCQANSTCAQEIEVHLKPTL